MELKIQSIQFNVTEKLQAFIQKKFAKIAKFNENISAAEVILKVTKPETANNKSTVLNIKCAGRKLPRRESLRHIRRRRRPLYGIYAAPIGVNTKKKQRGKKGRPHSQDGRWLRGRISTTFLYLYY